MSELAKTSRPAAAGLGRLVGAFRCSVAGLRYAARNEAAFRQELIVSALLLVPALALPVARFERLVLIQHQGCAFYRQWLKVRDEALEARQLDDLHKAAELMRRRHPELRVDAFFARRLEAEVRFEPVALPAGDGAFVQGLTSTQST